MKENSDMKMCAECECWIIQFAHIPASLPTTCIIPKLLAVIVARNKVTTE
jgi:hypothetical protein